MGLGCKSRFFLLLLHASDLSLYAIGRGDVCKHGGSWAVVIKCAERRMDATAEGALPEKGKSSCLLPVCAGLGPPSPLASSPLLVLGSDSRLGSCTGSKDFVSHGGPNSKVKGISTK